MSRSEGERFRMGRFKISTSGFLEIRDIDEDNQKLIVNLRINGEEVEREVDHSALS